MDSDVDVSRWVLEFLLSDREMESVAKQLLAVEPLSDHDWRLKKTVLLRTIESQIFDEVSVTETILDFLESIEVLDRAHQISISDSMRAAYCAVATECTVKFLVCGRGKPSGKYMEAVDRIWRGRVRALEESEGCELVSAELKDRRDQVEAGIWDIKVSKKLARMNTRNDALRRVAVYVEKALAMLDPPFIAWAVRFNMHVASLGLEGDQVAVRNGAKLEVNGANVNDGFELEPQRGANVEAGSEMALLNVNSESEMEAQGVNGEKGASHSSEQEVQRANGVNVTDASEPETHDTMNGVELQLVGAGSLPSDENGGVLSFGSTKEKETPRNSTLRCRHGPVKIRDAEDVIVVASADIYNIVSSAECRKVQEELKSSVLALKSVVTDPLPYALRVPEVVRPELGIRPVDHISGENGGAPNISVAMNTEPDQFHNDDHGNQPIHQNDVPQPSGKESDGPYLSVDKEKETEYVRTCDVNPGNPSRSYQNNVSRAGLMERNSTAHTFEWDDGLGMSPEQTGRLHLPSPKRNAVSPLQKYEDKKYKRRRYVKRWSLHEVDTLRTGVQKYGKGNWKFILNTYQDVFEERTEVDLKDKWRNLTSRGTCE